MTIKIFSRIKEGDIFYNNNNNEIIINNKKQANKFKINHTWGPRVSNNEIFENINTQILNNKLSFIVAFGYTGSGKTYTTINLLRNLIEYNKSKNKKITLESYQIYNSKVYDLLNNNQEVRHYKVDKIVIQGLVKKEILNTESTINEITNNRNISSTTSNNVSSRSHGIYKLKIDSKKTITIIDLAGQEYGNESHNQLLQKEAAQINLDMLNLKECIRNFKDNKPYIPYRQSIITFILKPIFDKLANIYFICTINGNHNKPKIIDSLYYASSLYKEEICKKTNMEENKLLMSYSEYLQDINWYQCKENDLWREMKKGNFSKKDNISYYLEKKEKIITDFKNKLPFLK